jgi:hypothetical protein
MPEEMGFIRARGLWWARCQGAPIGLKERGQGELESVLRRPEHSRLLTGAAGCQTLCLA